MRSAIRSSLLGLVVLVAAGALLACGDQGDPGTTRNREAMPFMRIKLKNTSPPEGRPARATVAGRHMGAPGPVHETDPVPPGMEAPSNTPGDQAADEVSITVAFEEGPTFRGEGAWPGSFISEVEIECGMPQGGMARVHFATGQPAEEIPLHE